MRFALLLLLALAGQRAARPHPRPVAVLAPESRSFSLTVDPPSVLVVVCDDVGWTEWSLMPELQGLAAQGVTFERAYAQPVCTTGRISLMYGRYPRRYGIGDLLALAAPTNEKRIPTAEVSLAELFGATHTSGAFGKIHLGRSAFTGQINVQVSQPYCDGWITARAIEYSIASYYAWSRCDNGTVTTNTVYATDAQRAEAVTFWAGTAGPKLAWVGWADAHVAGGSNGYQPPPGLSYTGTDRGDYEQKVEHMDAQLGLLLAAVDLEDTIVIVTCDNGTPDDQTPSDGPQPLGQPNGIWKGTTYEGGVRVPLVIAGPGISQGVVSQRLVSHLDLGATLAEIIGQPTRGFGDGVSYADELGPQWTGQPARTWLFCERYVSGGTDDQSVIEANWKLRRVDGQNHWYYLPSGEGQEIQPSQMIQDRLLAELASLPPRAP